MLAQSSRYIKMIQGQCTLKTNQGPFALIYSCSQLLSLCSFDFHRVSDSTFLTPFAFYWKCKQQQNASQYYFSSFLVHYHQKYLSSSINYFFWCVSKNFYNYIFFKHGFVCRPRHGLSVMIFIQFVVLNSWMQFQGFQAKKVRQFKIFKERQLNKTFIKALMSLLAPAPQKHRRITKRVAPLSLRLKNKILSLKRQKYANPSPTKCFQANESQTKMQSESPLRSAQPIVSTNLKYFQSFNPYTLGAINSITLSGGRIYDLLNMKTSQFHRSRIIKCRCTKSKCSVKYCDCYANGEACGSSCECLSCLNLVYSSNSRKSEDRICRCSRSGCSKKYCECFQRGDSCSSKCQCTNCHNSSGSGLRNQF